ncbi:MAG: AEC family transporter [Rhodospirillaceae bacterium]|jgi:malonate transporter and related proteins|nr:AEC family transporter [Rhodospirillaceae bacterium]
MGPIVNIVLPIFAIVFVGYLVGRRGLLGAASSEALNAFVYYVALPVLLFRSMARVDPEAVEFGPFLVVFIGGGVLTFFGAFAVARWIYGARGVNGLMFGVNATYGNTGYMGIPLAFAAFGEAGGVLTVIATVSHALVWLPISIVALESAKPTDNRPGAKLKAVISGVIRNPMLMAPVAGIVWSLSGFDLPTPVDAFCSLLGAAAGPCALFSIGLFLVGKPVSEGIGEVGAMVAFKLVVFPLVVAGLAFGVVELPPLPTAVALLLAASPTGATCFVLAQNYATFVQRSSSVILVSTGVAVVTVSVLFATPYLNLN